MRTPSQLANDYVSVWNERDPERRKSMLANGWTSDAVYADPLMQASGLEAIGALIDAVQARFPDFRFDVIGAPDGHGDYSRFSWALGPVTGDAVVKGTDVVRCQGGRIDTVTGFIDQMPAAR